MRHEERKLDRQYLVGVGLAVLLMGAMFFGVWSLERSLHRQQKALTRLGHNGAASFEFLHESCVRLQIVRIEDNASHYADWRVFRGVLKLPLNPVLAAQINKAASTKTWVPPTDCLAAINRFGIRYRAPLPVRFDIRLPPYDAVHLTARNIR